MSGINLGPVTLVTAQSAAPGTPSGGQLYYDTDDGNLYVYDAVATAWVDMTASGSGAQLNVANTWTAAQTFNPGIKLTNDNNDPASGIRFRSDSSVNLYSATSDLLQTDNILGVKRSSAGQTALAFRVSGEFYDRFKATAEGSLLYGGGGGSEDLRVERESSGVLAVRNGGDSDYADLKVKNLTISGTQTGGGGSATIYTTSVPFTDGDTMRRVTVSNGSVSAASKIVGAVIRPNIADSADPGYMYDTTIVNRTTGAFDLLIVCSAWGFDDPAGGAAPNETVEYQYVIG